MKQIARATIPLALLLAWPLSCAAADLPCGVGMPPDTGRVLHELEPRRQIVTGAERPKIDTNVPESAQADGNLRAHLACRLRLRGARCRRGKRRPGRRTDGRGSGALTFPGEAGKCPAFREYSHDEKHGSCAVFY